MPIYTVHLNFKYYDDSYLKGVVACVHYIEFLLNSLFSCVSYLLLCKLDILYLIFRF